MIYRSNLAKHVLNPKLINVGAMCILKRLAVVHSAEFQLFYWLIISKLRKIVKPTNYKNPNVKWQKRVHNLCRLFWKKFYLQKFIQDTESLTIHSPSVHIHRHLRVKPWTQATHRLLNLNLGHLLPRANDTKLDRRHLQLSQWYYIFTY